MKKYTIGRGPTNSHNKSKKPKKSPKEAKKERKKYIQREQQIVQKVMRENEGNPTMGFKNYAELIKYMQSNHVAHERDGFYTNTVRNKDYQLAPAEGQNRPTILVDGKVVYHPKSRASIHRHFLEEGDRRDAMKDVISKKTQSLTGTPMQLPHVLDSISKFGANDNVNIKRTHFSPTKIPIKYVSAIPDPSSRRGGKKNKKNKTRRK
jgi:hypothetical protein